MALNAYVYRWIFGDCTNGGVSAKASGVIVIGPGEAVPENATVPVLRVVHRWEGTPRHYIHLEPVARPDPKTHAGPMAGGNFAYTSDSRWASLTGCSYPLSIHDRFETWSEYDALSR